MLANTAILIQTTVFGLQPGFHAFILFIDVIQKAAIESYEKGCQEVAAFFDTAAKSTVKQESAKEDARLNEGAGKPSVLKLLKEESLKGTNKPIKITMEEVTIFLNGRKSSVPLGDYYEMKVAEFGFDSYEALKRAGVHIDKPRTSKKKDRNERQFKNMLKAYIKL